LKRKRKREKIGRAGFTARIQETKTKEKQAVGFTKLLLAQVSKKQTWPAELA
jgi:hypothetical protein